MFACASGCNTKMNTLVMFGDVSKTHEPVHCFYRRPKLVRECRHIWVDLINATCNLRRK